MSDFYFDIFASPTSGATHRSRPTRPPTSVHDLRLGSRVLHYRGGQVRRVAGDVVTIRVHLQHSLIGDVTVPIGMFNGTDASPVPGSPLAVRLDGEGDEARVVAVRGACPIEDDRDVLREAESNPQGFRFVPGDLRGVAFGCDTHQLTPSEQADRDVVIARLTRQLEGKDRGWPKTRRRNRRRRSRSTS